MSSYSQQFPELAGILEKADHVDVKTVISRAHLREFLAGMMGYQPSWVTFLYGVRMVFVRFLGMRQEGIPHARRLLPENIPMEPGKPMAFFTVRLADTVAEQYWAADADDQHLRATLAVVMRPLADGRNQFFVITVVHYHNWAGPVYFNVIRPFHHVVVGGMTRAGASA